MFAQTYVAEPLGEVKLVPVAVMSVHEAEHSKSTTTVPSAPEDVPVMLTTRSQIVRCSEIQHNRRLTMDI